MPHRPNRSTDNNATKLTIEQLEPRAMLAGDGLLGEYFNEQDLTAPAGTRVDGVVNFPNDALGANAAGMVTTDDVYSIRWTGWVLIDQPGNWQFTTFSNDGVRLWVDDTQLIDNWNQHASARDDGSISLSSGWHPIRMEYFQQDGLTDARLLFSGPGQAETIIPQTHLSSTDPNTGLPQVNAGPDRVVVLPNNSVTIDGSATDNGRILSRAWTQVSGPNTATLSGAATNNLTASNLVAGQYVFELTAADEDNNVASDTVTVSVVEQTGAGAISGELKKWHKVTVTFDGPQSSETAAANPFLDYRFDVTFNHAASGKSYTVPGYYAADGDAANTGATSGNKWRVHFAPSEEGEWTYVASFRTGANVAVADNPLAGVSAGFFDNTADVFEIAATDKTGIDNRGKGQLQYVGERYLRFAETGDYILKQGPDAPENLLAYDEFDGPFGADGQNDHLVKDWAPHVQDWNPGDPTWGVDQRGKGLIGAVNYLAEEGQNAFSFLPMNIGGDDRNVFPYLDYNERVRMDVSRLDQWEVVFEHADSKGMFLHFKTQETENDHLLDGGALGTQRKLYYRELVARFSHHLALNWNLGEENTNSTAQRVAFAQHFKDLDPYDHHIVLHTFPGQQNSVYTPLLGNQSELTGASLQTNNADFSQVHQETLTWVNNSESSGKPWAVAVDEPGDPQHALRPDNDAGNSQVDGRKNALWGTLLAGGWGNEWYFGYGHAHSDLTLTDFRSRDQWWDVTRYALEFFKDNDIPFWEMQNENGLISNSNDYTFAKQGEVYVVYLKNGGTTNLDLSGFGGAFEVKWYDPRNGGPLQDGTVTQIAGGGVRGIGAAPNNTNQDWAVLVRRSAATGPNQAPTVSITEAAPAVAEDGVFQEENGLVLFEIESQTPTDGWRLQNDVPGHTGDGYFRWEGPDLFGNPGAQGIVQYKFNITNAGTYQMRLHNHRNGGIPFDQENDVWTRMDNGQWIKVFSGTQGQWNWASNFDFGEGNRPSASYQLSAGEHTFTISGRSNGFRIDRVALFNTSMTSAGVAQNLNTPTSSTGEQTDDLTFDLEALVSDDGQQLITPQVTWSLSAGPGTAQFTSPNSTSTRVSFSQPGVYRVKLTAFDGEFTTSATRVIIAPAVELPSDEITFTPTDDATVEGASGINDAFLKVQPGGPQRTGYLKFNVSGLTGEPVDSVKLRLTVSQDGGSGPLNLYTGSTNNWTEEAISAANAPSPGTLVDSASGSHTIGSVVEFDVSSAITGDGVYTFVLQHGGGNDVWFSSKEGATAPQLVAGLDNHPTPGDYDLSGEVTTDDYTFWRISHGSTIGDGLFADGNRDAVVNAADYAIWRDLTAAPSSPQRATAAAPVEVSDPQPAAGEQDDAVEPAAFMLWRDRNGIVQQSIAPAQTPAPAAALEDDLLLLAIDSQHKANATGDSAEAAAFEQAYGEQEEDTSEVGIDPLTGETL